MEVSVIERINVVLKHFCKTPNSLANMLEMIPSTVNRQLKGDQALSSKVIEGVLSVFPDVSAEWLLRGKGEMLISEQTTLAKMQDTKGRESDVVEHYSVWKAKYEELEKRYDQLFSILGCSMRKADVG